MNRFEDGSFSVINSCKCIKLGLELEGLSGACWPKPVIPLPGSTSPAASWNSPREFLGNHALIKENVTYIRKVNRENSTTNRPYRVGYRGREEEFVTV